MSKVLVTQSLDLALSKCKGKYSLLIDKEDWDKMSEAEKSEIMQDEAEIILTKYDIEDLDAWGDFEIADF